MKLKLSGDYSHGNVYTHCVFVCLCVPLDEFDGSEGLVHVPNGEVEAEVQHGVSGLLLTALQTNKVT